MDMKRILLWLLPVPMVLCWAFPATAELRVGAARIDVTPIQFPVLVNGGMTSRTVDRVKTPLHARAIVLDDQQVRLAIVVVDSCMLPRPLLDEAKQLAAERTRIRPDRMLISATHTHTAPSSMACLGTDVDPTYVPYLREKLAEAIATAESRLQPAEVGWGVESADEFTALRRWIRRPDRMAEDPFGNLTVRANMHAGRVWDDVTGESGPKDPDLSLISFRSTSGRPLAVLANFSMHYFGDRDLSSDYFGLFCDGLEKKLGGGGERETAASEKSSENSEFPFVAIMSHGCSGDIWRRDYTKPAPDSGQEPTIESYTAGLLEIAGKAYASIDYQADADLAMAEARMTMNYRVPDRQRLEWARRIVEQMGDRLPRDTTEVYAREQVMLHENPSTEIVVQALRIGEIAIATTPNETYALTGLKLKFQSPLPKTMVIELANGGDGYIPPPEQHLLGGYNTWAARSAGLDVQAEPKITEASLGLLEQVSGSSRRPYRQSLGEGGKAILELKPVAYWRLDEFSGPRAVDVSGHHRDAFYEPGVVFFLEGPRHGGNFTEAGETNRAAHFAGGRLESRLANLEDRYTVSLWCWNGMPLDGREVAGWMFSRGHNHGLAPHGDHLGLGGASHPGRLIFLPGKTDAANVPLVGQTEIARWSWSHVVMVRDGDRVRIYLNGNPQPEIDANAPGNLPLLTEQFYFGGRCDNDSNWEGRLDEIAVFDRPLTPTEIEGLYQLDR
jgi:hypothetical protein